MRWRSGAMNFMEFLCWLHWQVLDSGNRCCFFRIYIYIHNQIQKFGTCPALCHFSLTFMSVPVALAEPPAGHLMLQTAPRRRGSVLLLATTLAASFLRPPWPSRGIPSYTPRGEVEVHIQWGMGHPMEDTIWLWLTVRHGKSPCY
jgi:hypothetical protein